MKHLSFKHSVIFSAVAAASLITVDASAQVLEEVVVTARKRAESMQDVPMPPASRLTTACSGRLPGCRTARFGLTDRHVSG